MKKILSMVSAIIIVMMSVTAYADTVNMAALCYHSVTDSPLDISAYRISAADMEGDLKYFSENGYTFLLPREMWYADANKKNIVLTFDDGYEDFYRVVYPLLRKYNAKAAVYVIGSRIGKYDYMNEEQIKELDASGIVEIGCHTNSVHLFGYKKSDLENDKRLVTEYIRDVREFNDKMTALLGHKTESIAYPFGIYVPELETAMRKDLSFNTTFSTQPGIIKERSDILKPMKRLYRIQTDTMADIECRINKYK